MPRSSRALWVCKAPLEPILENIIKNGPALRQRLDELSLSPHEISWGALCSWLETPQNVQKLLIPNANLEEIATEIRGRSK